MNKMFVILLSLLSIVSSFTSAHGQTAEARPNLHKTLSIGMGFETGTLVNNTDGIFDRNEFTLGISYAQNFASAEWFTLNIGLGVINFINYTNRNNGDALNPNFELLGVTGADFVLDYAQVTLQFSDYFALTIRQQFLTFAYVFYPIALPRGQQLLLYGGIEFFPYKRFAAPGSPNSFETTLDYIEFGFEYFVTLPKGFTYSMQIAFVSRGRSFSIGDTLIYEAGSAAAYLHNFEIEWDNTISYSNGDGFSAGLTLRYLASRLGNLNVPTSDRRVNHDFVIVGSMGYSFDFQKLINKRA